MPGARPRSEFACAECGARSPRWLGRCPECQTWDSLRERPAAPAARRGAAPPPAAGEDPRPVTEVPAAAGSRLPTGLGELDRILGGGLVPGAAVLVGGDPGVGKSTLLLQVCAALARRGAAPVLYATGEESALQVRLRAERVGALHPGLLLYPESDLEAIAGQVRRLRPACLVVDSIQTARSAALDALPGAVGQLRQCAQELVALAKGEGVPVFLIGHVTKDGAIAGPRLLEHLVDTVLYFEGERQGEYRLLRAVKNRFGSTDEIGVFAMAPEGLREVADPGGLFLGENPAAGPGAAITCLVEGSRPLVVELQALTAPAGPGIPARRVSGPDPNRLALILAVLEKRLGLGLGARDVFACAVGGMRVEEPAADLALAAAVASSLRDKPLAPRAAFLGELGLSGELRPVGVLGPRVAELARRGFTRVFVPGGGPAPAGGGAELIACRRLSDCLERAFG